MKRPRVFVAGHKGMVGSAIFRELINRDDCEIIVRDRNQLNLLDQHSVRTFFQSESIDQVYLAAARVGGIYANNTYPADFIYENLMIEANVIHEASKADVKKILFLGSSCIYPKFATQPITEDELLTGSLEATNEPYAIAKIAGIKMCESYNRQFGRDYRSVMPTNLYGVGDNYHSQNSHVIPALIRRFHEAKVTSADSVSVWGTGKPRREFLYVDDLAIACVHIMNLDASEYAEIVTPTSSHINIGSGFDVTISDIAYLIADVVGFKGEIKFDSSKPDGTPRKLMDSRRAKKLGWSAATDLRQGLTKAYADFVSRIQ